MAAAVLGEDDDPRADKIAIGVEHGYRRDPVAGAVV